MWIRATKQNNNNNSHTNREDIRTSISSIISEFFTAIVLIPFIGFSCCVRLYLFSSFPCAATFVSGTADSNSNSNYAPHTNEANNKNEGTRNYTDWRTRKKNKLKIEYYNILYKADQVKRILHTQQLVNLAERVNHTRAITNTF